MEKAEIQEQALEVLLPFSRGTAVISMRVGKTFLGLQYIDDSYTNTLRVLVAAPRISIFQSWRNDIDKFNMTYLEPQIEYTTYLSLSKQDLNYDILILDEVHNLVENSHSQWLNEFKGKILGLTGTKPRHGSDKANMISKYCPIRYEYSTDQAVEDEILNDYRIIVHSLSLDKNKTIRKKTKSGGFWMTSEQSEYNYWDTRIQNSGGDKERMMCRIMRMKAIQSFPTKEIYAKKLFNSINEKVIIFANTQKQAESLCKDTYHSKNSLSEENLINFGEGIITRLAAVEQLSEGITIPDLKEAIIMHTFSGNSPKSRQKFGRTLGLNINEISNIHILRYLNTIDSKWVQEVLDTFDPDKITYK